MVQVTQPRRMARVGTPTVEAGGQPSHPADRESDEAQRLNEAQGRVAKVTALNRLGVLGHNVPDWWVTLRRRILGDSEDEAA